MDKKPFEAPKLYTLGKVQKLTQGVEKCRGSGDAFFLREPANQDAICVIDEVP